MSLWLKEEGLSRSTIGWAGLIFGVYAFNYLWAPLIDRLQIPYLTKKLGHRRGWIVLMQTAILICLIVWSLINPTENLALLITVGLIIAIASATQDITVDALRIEQIGENEGNSMAIELPSFSPICSILNASTVISCVADAIAMINPTVINSARFSVGFIKLHTIKQIKIAVCIKTIQPRL